VRFPWPTLKAAIERLAATAASHDRAQSRNHGRNRDEIRAVTVFDPADALADTDWHPPRCCVHHDAANMRFKKPPALPEVYIINYTKWLFS